MQTNLQNNSMNSVADPRVATIPNRYSGKKSKYLVIVGCAVLNPYSWLNGHEYGKFSLT